MKKLILFPLIVALAIVAPFTPMTHVAFAGNTYATFNSADCNAAYTLSGGNLTATHSGANAWRACRSDIGKSTGKWYWEYTIGADGVNATHDHGVMTSSGSLTAELNSNSNSADYLNQGFYYCSTVEHSGVASYTTGAVIGFALDAGAGTIDFYKNNTLIGSCSGLSGVQYAAVSMFDQNNALTANFGATALTYTPPSGYNAGLYNTGGSGFSIWQFDFF